MPTELPDRPDPRSPPPGREPVFNVPGVILATIVVLAAIHAGRGFIDWRTDVVIIYGFGFVPGRYLLEPPADIGYPLSPFGGWFGPITHALLHASWTHLIVNTLWLVAFGSPIARRFGARRFLIFSAVCALGGAVAHLATHWGGVQPMIGASGVVSGYMAGAMRFAFQTNGPMSSYGRRAPDMAARIPPHSIAQTFADPRALVFMLVFIGINLMVGIGGGLSSDATVTVAWQAHLGGFVAGLLAFDLIDRGTPLHRPVLRRREPPPDGGDRG